MDINTLIEYLSDEFGLFFIYLLLLLYLKFLLE